MKNVPFPHLTLPSTPVSAMAKRHESPEYRVIKKHYPRLAEAVTRDKVPGALFANDVITEEALEVATSPSKIRREKGAAIMKDVLQALRDSPTEAFQGLCESLSEESSLKNILEELKGQCVI